MAFGISYLASKLKARSTKSIPGKGLEEGDNVLLAAIIDQTVNERPGK
jgi:hypothetical protein